MRTRQITLIGTLTGLGVLLLASLAVIYATRAQTVYAQDPPELSLSVSMGEVSLPQGGSTYIAATVHNLPRDANNQASLPELTYGRDLFRVLSDESTENANGCANGMGGNTPVNSVYANPKIVGSGWDNFTIKSDCPTGSYRVRMSVKHKDDSTDLVFGTKDFTVIPGPSVTIALSSDSFYRGTSSDVTMEFSYLNNMQDGSDLSYRADIIRRVTETVNNFADKCEGAGLGNIDKSDDSDSHLSNLGDSPSGAIEDQDGDGTVEVSGQIPTTCPTGRYKLTVELWDSSNSELTSTSIEFVVSTDPNATPSATVELSPPSPVTPGTEIDATISVYDLQDGADLKYRTDVIKRVNNADVVESSCHGDGIGLGQEFGFTVGRNPFVLRETISSNCPAGSYTLKSVITNGSGIEIVSGSADFTVGVIEANRVPVVTISTASARLEGGAMLVISGAATDPDSDSVEVSASTTGGALSAVTRSGDDWSVTLTAPAVTANPQTITVTISGEDPAGLTATASRAWTVGANVDPTVTIDQADMTVDGGASVDLSAVVAAPEAGQSVSTLWTATGGSYPDGDSGTTARWVAPAGGKTDTDYTLTATVEDALGATASDSIEVTVREDPNLRLIAPTVLNQTGTVGTAYTQTLDAWTGGVGRLRYTVTGQPGGLSFNEGTRTITGIPIAPVISEVTYTVIDNDGNGDEASTTFTITIIEANRVPVVTISTASARLEGGAMLVISGEATDPDSDSVEVSASTTGGTLSAVTRSGDDWSVTLTAPAVTANTQTITVTISGEDPAGLTATASRAWTVGANVDPTVTIDQADMTVDGGASVDLSAVVAAPEAGQSVSTLWTATGGSYPDGDSGTTARWVAPAGGKTDTDYTLTATVEDALGATASDSIEVTVREDPNLRLIAPTVLNQTGTVGTAYTQTLDAWTGGVGRLRYTVTGQPGGLSFNEGTRTITGIPIEPVISEVTYTVTDNDGNGDEASTTFTITIIEANRVPVVTISTASARLEGGATQVISGEATDPEGDSVEVSASTTGGALSAVTRSGDDWSVTLTAPAVTANPQTITVTISGEDPAGLTATASRAWTVGANVDPTVTIDQADMTVDGGASEDLSAVVAAPEAGQSVSTLWTATGGSYPDGDSGTTVRWVAPASGQTDTGYTLTATAEDALGATASDSIEVTVRADPNATLFAPTVLNQNGRVGTPYTQTLDAWTGGVAPLRYTVTGQPDGLSFNEGTRTITGIPVEAGRSLVTYTVTDNDGNGDEASTTFTITVIEANRAPVVTISTASASLEGGAMQVISGAATDPDSDSVEVSASTTGGALSAVTRSGDDWSVTLTAPAVTANPQTITVTISGEDPAGLTATASRAWTVGANVDPTVTIDQADMTVDGGASVDLSAVVAAPEAGQSVSTLWTATGGSYPDGDSGTTARWVAPAGGKTDTDYTLTATVEDALGATASDSIEVTVRADPNATLFAPTVLNQNGRVGTPYTQTLDAWTGGVAPLRYTVTGQPDGLSFNEGTRTITGIPVEAGRSLVTYTVTDNDGNGDEASTTFTITVIEANRAPVVTISTASASLEGGAMQVISGAATDPDSDSVEVSASTTGGALSAVTRSGDDWSVTLTAPAATAITQTITVTISGEDPAGLTATASRAWTVGANVDSQEQNQQNPGNQGNQQKRRSSSSQSSQPKSQSSPPPQQQSALPVAITQPILMNVRSGPGLYY